MQPDELGAAILPSNGFIRTMHGEIATWPLGMEQRYGFRAEEALGRQIHQLLRTMSWETRRSEIEAQLVRDNRWSGGLIHHHANGRPVLSVNRWFLRDGAPVGERLVLEVHSDITFAGRPAGQHMADVLELLAHALSEPATAAGNYLSASQSEAQRSSPDRCRITHGLEAAQSQTERTREIINRMHALGQNLRNPKGISLNGRLTATMEDIVRTFDRSCQARMELARSSRREARESRRESAMRALAEQLGLFHDLLETARLSHDGQTKARLLQLAVRLWSQVRLPD